VKRFSATRRYRGHVPSRQHAAGIGNQSSTLTDGQQMESVMQKFLFAAFAALTLAFAVSPVTPASAAVSLYTPSDSAG
jgi:hypothetical protein